MINVGELIHDPDFVQAFTVYRRSGDFVNGVWTGDTSEELTMLGVVTVMRATELRMVPEGDRISGGMNFHSRDPIYPTRVGEYQGTSDQILWRGSLYRVLNVAPYEDYGYYKASAERIEGA